MRQGRWLGDVQALSDSIHCLTDEEIWKFHSMERDDLVRYSRKRLARQLAQRGADPATVAEAEHVLDPEALTLGFARRFSEYKRPTLLLRDPERLRPPLGSGSPVQLIVAGKAHPTMSWASAS